MTVHGSREWKAVESTNFAGAKRKLRVTGKVQVGASNEKPVLAEAEPQGINETILILEVSTAHTGEPGLDVLSWEDAFFEKSISEDQYGQGDIRGHAIMNVVMLPS